MCEANKQASREDEGDREDERSTLSISVDLLQRSVLSIVFFRYFFCCCQYCPLSSFIINFFVLVALRYGALIFCLFVFICATLVL